MRVAGRRAEQTRAEDDEREAEKVVLYVDAGFADVDPREDPCGRDAYCEWEDVESCAERRAASDGL